MLDGLGAGHGQGPIIIKRVKAAEHRHRGGAWKVAYADMLTALLALFIVLWIFAQSEEVKSSVQHYFSEHAVGFKDGGAPSIMRGAGSGNQFAILDDVPSQKGDPEGVQARLRAKAEEIRNALHKIPSFDRYRDQVQLTVTPQGLRVNLLETQERPLFKIGSTELNPEFLEVLSGITRVIKNTGNSMIIEGHTDSTPFRSSSGRTNWELSTGRANTARRLFEQEGIAPKRILEVSGFADRQLYNPLDPSDSRNRRISITLLSMEALDAHKAIPEETLIPWLTE